MQIDPTPHKLYIYDLNAELADDISSDDETPVFLSDIERHLSKIPRHVLMAGLPNNNNNDSEQASDAPEPNKDNQVVLYNVPSSLSVPQERDSVRKAIVEARARVRERQASALGEPERVLLGSSSAGVAASSSGGSASGSVGVDSIPFRPDLSDPDVDAMDID